MSVQLGGETHQTSWMRWEEVLFNGMYFTENIRTQRWRVIKRKTKALLIMYMILDALQVYALIAAAHSGFDPKVTGKILSYIDVYNLFVSNNFENYKAFFWILVVAVLLDVLFFAYLAWRLRRQGAPMRSCRYFRVYTKVLLDFTLIAELKLCATPFICSSTDWVYGTAAGAAKPIFVCPKSPWALYVAAATALLSVLVPASVFLVSSACDFNLHADDWEAHPHARFHLPELLVKFALVAAAAAFPYPSLPLNWGILAVLAFLFYWLQQTLPYYQQELNEAKGAVWGGALALAVGGVVLPNAGDARPALTGVFLAACPAGVALGFALTRLRARRLLRMRTKAAKAEAAGQSPADAVQFRNEMEVELATRYLRSEGDTEVALADAERLYKAGIAQYPSSSYVQAHFAAFLRWRRKSPIQAAQELKAVIRTEPGVDVRYSVFCLRAEFEAENHAAAGTSQDDLFNSIENRRLYALARAQHAACLKQLKAFWRGLSKKNLGVQGALTDVPTRLSAIDGARNGASKAYKTLLERYPRSRLLLRAYGHFLEHCANDAVNAQNMYLRADEIEEEETQARQAGGRRDERASAAGGRGRGRDDRSESSKGESSSQGGSSSHNSSQKGRRAGREELRLRSTDVVAVRRLGYGVILGLILLAGSAAGMFIVVKVLFGQYANSMYLMRVASYQRRRIVAANSFFRSMHLSALRNDSAEYAQHAGELRIRAEDFHGDHYGLYHGFPEVAVTPSTDKATRAYWAEADVRLIRVLPPTTSGAPAFRRIDVRSVWDVGNIWIMKAKRIAYLPWERLRDPASIADVAFLMANSLNSILDAIAGLNSAFTTEVYTIIDTSKVIFGCVMAFRIATLVVLTFAVFRPAFKKVRGTMQGINLILTGLSKHSLKKMGRRYAKIKGFKGGPEHAHHHGHGHGGGGGGGAGEVPGGEYDYDDEDDDAGSQDAGSDEEHSGSERSSASEHSRASGRGREEDEEGEAEGESGEDEDRRRKKKKGKKEKKLKKPSRKGDEAEGAEAGPSGDANASRHSIVLRGTAKHRARRESVAVEESMEMAEVAAAEGGAAPPAPGPGPPGGGPGPAEGASAAPAATPQTTARKEKEKTHRSHHHGTHRSGTHRSKKGGEKGEEVSGAERTGTSASGSQARPRRPSLKPTAAVEPAAAELPEDGGLSSAMATRVSGVLRRRTGRQGSLLPPEAPAPGMAAALVATRARTAAELDASAAAHAAAGAAVERAAEDAATRAGIIATSRSAGSAKTQKGKQSSEQGEKQRDILDVLTRKYLVAFALIGAVALGNFLIAFFVLEAGKGFASELEAAGRRRYLAREIYFLSRELCVNDGLFAPREAIYARLRQAAADLSTVQQGLKFGNATLRLPGADRRYKPQDQVMYDVGCLRTDASKCTPDRVSDIELVNNGLDLLVSQFVDLVIPIIQECAPDLLVPYAFQPHTSLPPPVPKVADYAGVEASLAVRIMTQVDNGDLDDGLSRSARLFIEESESSLGTITLAEAAILAFDFAFLALLFALLFLPMLRRLRDESSRVDQLLRMFPKDVVYKSAHMHRFFFNFDDEEQP